MSLISAGSISLDSTFKIHYKYVHRKKKLSEFPVPSRDVTTKLFLGENNDVTYKLFLPRESLVSDIPAGVGKLDNLFIRCTSSLKFAIINPVF
jgi:hypothetical protein